MHYSSISSHFSVCRFHFSESKNIHYCHNFVFLHCQMVVTPPIKLLTMKRIIIISLLLLSLGAKAQDVIVTNSTQVIQAYRIEMGQTNIYYQLNEADTAAIHRIAKAEVMVIRYADGRKVDPNAASDTERSYGTVTYLLEGRQALVLIPSNMRSPRSGKVVVRVWVNREGRVTKVFAPANGSTLTDASIVKQLKLLARQSEFTPNPDAPEEQMGEVIYTF